LFLDRRLLLFGFLLLPCLFFCCRLLSGQIRPSLLSWLTQRFVLVALTPFLFAWLASVWPVTHFVSGHRTPQFAHCRLPLLTRAAHQSLVEGFQVGTHT